MNFEIAKRYFASFGWSLTRATAHDSGLIFLHDAENAAFGEFDSVRSAMTSWMALIRIAYAHEHSVETAVRLAGEDADHRAAILEWARSGGTNPLPHDLDMAINPCVVKIRGDNATVLVHGKRLAPLIARERADLTADILARICEKNRNSLDRDTYSASQAATLVARL